MKVGRERGGGKREESEANARGVVGTSLLLPWLCFGRMRCRRLWSLLRISGDWMSYICYADGIDGLMR